jgi:hypothetical protein
MLTWLHHLASLGLNVLLAGRAAHPEGGGWSYNNRRPGLGKFRPSPITNAQIVRR